MRRPSMDWGEAYARVYVCILAKEMIIGQSGEFIEPKSTNEYFQLIRRLKKALRFSSDDGAEAYISLTSPSVIVGDIERAKHYYINSMF